MGGRTVAARSVGRGSASCRAILEVHGEELEGFRAVMDAIGRAIDALGVLAIVAGVVVASFRSLAARGERIRIFRHDVGQAILLGLELLVAGDIIRTVVVAPTLENVAVLAVIVAIRTFLSFTLQLEVEGRWPWQASARPAPQVAGETADGRRHSDPREGRSAVRGE
jgi:uncharacterized membrane protein